MDLQIQARVKINQPCAACRMLRRRCGVNCQLAPYFPADEVENFAGVHKVFGASNLIKMLQMVEESKRGDAVKSIVYEARARVEDPVYGSAGSIFYLQKHLEDLKAQLELTRARILESEEERNQLLRVLMDVHSFRPISPIDDAMFDCCDLLLDERTMGYDPVEFPIDSDWMLS